MFLVGGGEERCGQSQHCLISTPLRKCSALSWARFPLGQLFPMAPKGWRTEHKIWIFTIPAPAAKLNCHKNPVTKLLIQNSLGQTQTTLMLLRKILSPPHWWHKDHSSQRERKITLLFSLFSIHRQWHSKESKFGLTVRLGKVLLKWTKINLLLNFCICFAESALPCHYWTMEWGNEAINQLVLISFPWWKSSWGRSSVIPKHQPWKQGLQWILWIWGGSCKSHLIKKKEVKIVWIQ